VTRVALSEEQMMLTSTAAQLVVDHPTLVDPGPERAAVETRLWESLVDCGLVALLVPQGLGGEAGSVLDAALVVEQLARGVAAVPYLGTALATALVVAAGPNGTELGELLAGRRGSVVFDQSLTRPEVVGIAVDAGSESLTIGIDADTVFTSELGESLRSIDFSRPLVRAIGSRTRLGAISADGVLRWHALALALLSADIVGAAAGALEGCVAYARSREQFGRPVGSFQAVQHLCADQLVGVEGCRSVMWQAAWAVDTLEPAESLTLAQVAKAHCSEVGRTVCEAAIQVWGGLGMTWECPAHRFLRRVMLDRQLLGDERVQLGAISDARLGRPSPEVN
jgi:alkylation response protein AidB-like acyl-CoA dehydrogenase